MPDPQMRAADTDRESVARRLGEHMSAGRLTVAEYEDRVARAYAAKTYGELTELTRDLPTGRTAAPHAAAEARPRPAATGGCGSWGSSWGSNSWGGVPWGGSWAGSHWRRAAWGSWFTTALIVTTIWLLTSLSSGALLYFWPIWVIGPWGAVLLAQTLAGGGRPRSHHDHHHRGRL